MESVEFDNDAFGGKTTNGRADAACSGQIDVCLVANLLYSTSLDDCPIDLSEITLTNLGCHIGEVQVRIVECILIDVLAKIRIGGVGRTEVNGTGIREVAIATLTCAGSCENTNFEGASGSMFSFCSLGNLCRCTFGNACGRKATQANSLSILDKCCSFGSGKFIKVHRCMMLIFCAQRYEKLRKLFLLCNFLTHINGVLCQMRLLLVEKSVVFRH